MRPAVPLLMLCVFVGCDDRPIEQYRAPKQARPSLMTETAQPTITSAPTAGELSWELPEGWRAVEPGPVRVAAFEAGEPDQRVEVAVTVFAGDVGGELANVNRWRQQMRLPPVESLDGQPITRYTVEGREAYQIELPGLLAAGVRDGERTWFVKMTGPAEAVADERDAFAAFMQSLHWHGEPQSGGEGEIAP